MLKGEKYCITKENIMAHEMIGLEVKIVQSSDASRLVSGLVVDETKNTFTIESSGKQVIAPKAECTFEFTLGNEQAVVLGSKILYAPEQRVRALWRN